MINRKKSNNSKKTKENSLWIIDEFKELNVSNLKPEILTHPNIPIPLHGINPRSIMGQKWWDSKRQEIYAKYDYHCIACGIHKNNIIGKKWLECHEYWNIDYDTGICKVISLEPLCNSCHSFIHSGHMYKTMMSGKISFSNAIKILEDGFLILSKNNLKCFPGTMEIAKILNCNTFNVESYKILINEKLKWQDFKLIFEGIEYHSKFKDFNEWDKFYNK